MKTEYVLRWLSIFIIVIVSWIAFRVHRGIEDARERKSILINTNLPEPFVTPIGDTVLKSNDTSFLFSSNNTHGFPWVTLSTDHYFSHGISDHYIQTSAFIDSHESPETKVQTTRYQNPETYWVKVGFSGMFALIAFYIILSKRYDAQTRKWAFSTLTLIAGFWIGTAI